VVVVVLEAVVCAAEDAVLASIVAHQAKCVLLAAEVAALAVPIVSHVKV